MNPFHYCLSFFLLLIVSSVQAQPEDAPTHRVPFAAAGNTLALTVANAAGDEATAVLVTVAAAPDWLAVTPDEVALDSIAAGAEAVASFTFDVGTDVPIGEAAEVRFAITSAAGTPLAEKVVRLEVAPPERFTLVGAYPNPFRAEARVAYELPAPSDVRLEVYDVLGRRVATVEAEEQAAGRQEAVWNGAGASSGVYLWRLVVEGPTEREVEQGRLTLIR